MPEHPDKIHYTSKKSFYPSSWRSWHAWQICREIMCRVWKYWTAWSLPPTTIQIADLTWLQEMQLSLSKVSIRMKQFGNLGQLTGGPPRIQGNHFQIRTPPNLVPSPSHSLPALQTSLYPFSFNIASTPPCCNKLPKNTRWRGHSCFQGYRGPNPDVARRGAGIPGTDAGKGEGGNSGFTAFGKYVSRYTLGKPKNTSVWSSYSARPWFLY